MLRVHHVLVVTLRVFPVRGNRCVRTDRQSRETGTGIGKRRVPLAVGRELGRRLQVGRLLCSIPKARLARQVVPFAVHGNVLHEPKLGMRKDLLLGHPVGVLLRRPLKLGSDAQGLEATGSAHLVEGIEGKKGIAIGRTRDGRVNGWDPGVWGHVL